MFEAFVLLRPIQAQYGPSPPSMLQGSLCLRLITRENRNSPGQTGTLWEEIVLVCEWASHGSIHLTDDPKQLDVCMIKARIRTASCTRFGCGTEYEEGGCLCSYYKCSNEEPKRNTRNHAGPSKLQITKKEAIEVHISIARRCIAILLHGYASVCLILPWHREGKQYRKIVLGWS